MPGEVKLHTLLGNIDLQLKEALNETAVAELQPKVERVEYSRYILVEVGSLKLALSIENLAEIGALPPITFLPNLPSWIQGVVSIRSEIISVIDFLIFMELR